MKRFVSTLAVAALALLPLSALAATLGSGDQYSLSPQKVVNGNLYIAAGTATVGGRVSGDIWATGGTVSLNGSVGGDVTAAGGTVEVLGSVAGDVRATGGTVTVSERVGGDFVVAGGSVHVLPGAVVQGDLIVAGGQVAVDGTVMGSVRMVGGMLSLNGTVNGDVHARSQRQIVLGSTAQIRGDFDYRSSKAAQMDAGSSVGGKVTFNPTNQVSMGQGTPQRIFWAVITVVTGMKLLAMLGLAALLMWRMKRESLEVIVEAHDQIWPSLGRGLAYSILMPIAAVLLIVSFIGALPGALLMMLYIAMWILTQALAGMFFGAWIAMLINKHPMHLTWTSALGGVVLLLLVSLIPFIGWIIGAVASLAVFGALANRAHHHWSSRTH